MTILLVTILIICTLGVLHTYVLYPWLVRSPSITDVDPPRRKEGWDWPPVTVIMAAHNEESVIAQKLRTLSMQDYPGRLHFLVGSDNSTDGTNGLLAEYAGYDERLRVSYFAERQGKPAIVNRLATEADPSGILVLTDASVMLRADTVTELVRPMAADDRVGIVDSTMVQIGARPEGVGAAEADYIHREVSIKQAESRRWGAMIGPFGGCFALRAEAFRPVPPNFLVDDFYLCMAVYEQGYRGVSSSAAKVEEHVGQHLADEFSRKVRIGSGNWQNLVRFRGLWWPPCRDGLAYGFFSHKVLRWVTPFLLAIGAVAWLWLALRTGNHWVLLSFGVASGLLLGAAGADLLLSAVGLHVSRLRKVRYFLAMNLALSVGFWRYMIGIRSNVWQPSNRS